MAMYNADGSYGKMCGNGIRCVAKYVYDNGLTDKEELDILSGGAVKHLKLTVKNGRVEKVRVNMGEPILEPAKIPVAGKGEALIGEPVVVGQPGLGDDLRFHGESPRGGFYRRCGSSEDRGDWAQI